jgi:hypothetical protein
MYQQTPFRTDGPQTPMVAIDVNRPPVAFEIRCAPWIQQYLPYLTGVMMDMITRQAQGPVSMHFYNRMAQNNWANNDFGQEVANCADFIFLRAQGSQDPNIIPRLAEAYISLRTKFEATIVQPLRQFIAQQDQYMFDQAAQQFQGEITAIANLRNGVAQHQAPQQQQQPGNYPPPVQYAPPGSPAPAQGYAQQNYAAPPQARSSVTGRDYGTGTASAAPQMPPAMAQPAPVAPQPARPAPQPTQPQPAGAPVLNMADPDDVQWNPAPDTPHPMLYNPVRVKMMYTIVDGKTKPQPTKTTMDPINYDRHNINTMFNKPLEGQPVVKDNAEIAQQIKNAAHDAVEETNNVDEGGERIEETMGLRNVLSAFSLDTAILDLRTEMLAKIDRKNPPMIFQGYTQVFTALVGDKSEYDLIHKFADSSSFIELREKIRAAAATASPQLLTDVTLKLTQLMNDILRDRLSIQSVDKDPVGGIEVESFIDDLDALFDILKNRGENERMYKAFIKDQGRRIKAMFDAPVLAEEAGRQLHDDLTSGMLTKGWEDPNDPTKYRDDLPEFTFYGPTVRITFLNVVSHDLLIAGMLGVGNIVTKQHSAILYDLAVSLFDVETNGIVADRQLVITKDGRILEMFEGTLIPETYLMKLVK